MSKLPCEVVKDLFPSYIDELTGEVTNNLIEEHTNECEQCRQVLESMKSPEAEPEKQSQKKEIDYLKKTRKKYRKRIIAAILVVLAVVLGGLGVKHYFIGNTISYEYLTCVPEVNGQELSVVCMVADANMRISKIQFEEKEGVINITCKGVQRELVDVVGVKGSYVAEQKIKEVRLGDRILWAGGDNISTFTSSVYKTKHAEIQDTKTNIDTATALYLGYVFPGYKSVVQKENEPYGWHFQKGELLGDVKYLEKQYLEPYAYIMMAVVENLGEVTYEFKHKGEPVTLTYTAEMATKYAGKDIKLVGADIAELEKLIRKANLTDTHFWSET